jgi:hypothetical protein
MVLAACGAPANAPVVSFDGRPSMPSCSPMDEDADRTMRDVAVAFFVQEIGVKIEEIVVARGTICNGHALFAFSKPEDKFRKPFFVEVDLDTQRKVLMRPE